MSDMPPPAPDPEYRAFTPGMPPPPAPKMDRHDKVNLWVKLAGVAVVLAVIGSVIGKKDDDAKKDDGKGTELCALMRDPSNDILTRGDLERLSGFHGSELDRYVLERCPDLAWRI